MKLALFDLDHTLLSGDSDALWCEFLLGRGLLDAQTFAACNAQMAQGYREGSVTPQAFCEFYVSTLAGLSRTQAEPLRQAFLNEAVLPRIPASARALVEQHRTQGDTLLLTTATNRFLTELTARHLGIEHVIATEAEEVQGRFSGRTRGTLNMREGKVVRLREWLLQQGLDQACLARATFYSDSINDLPLLRAVGSPVAVDPDSQLAAHAQALGWRVLRLAPHPTH